METDSLPPVEPEEVKEEVKEEFKQEDGAGEEGSALPADEALQATLQSILEAADLEQLTKKMARRELESKLGLADGALDVKKTEIGSWVDKFIEERDKAAEADEEEEEEEEEEKPKKEKKEKKKSSGGSTGWKASYLKPALVEFTGGATEMKRSEVVKMIWDHVKANNLQDPKDKRFIMVDDRLNLIFTGKKKIHMFKMNKELSKHFGEQVGSGGPIKKAKKARSDSEGSEDEDEDEDDEEETGGSRKRKAAEPAKKPAKKKAGGGGGFQKEIQLSDELGDLLGSNCMARTQVVKNLWAYIKENNLQNPENKSQIIPDAKMKAVFGGKPFTGFSMMKLLKPHFQP